MEYLKGFVWSHSFLQCANGLHLALKNRKVIMYADSAIICFSSGTVDD